MAGASGIQIFNSASTTVCALGTTNDSVFATAADFAVVFVVDTITVDGSRTPKPASAAAAVSTCDPGIEKTSDDGEKPTIAATVLVTDSVAAIGHGATVASDGGTIRVFDEVIAINPTTANAADVDDYSCCPCRADCTV